MFTRDDTRAVKGVAVVLMLFHHLAAFSARWPVGFAGFTSLWKNFAAEGYLGDLAFHAILCVPLFFFLGGYGLYCRWSAGKFRLFDSLASLYRRYWKVFFVFVPIAFLFFARSGDGINELCTRYVFTDFKTFLGDFFANLTGYRASFNSEWWFLGAYLCALPLGVLFCCATRKHRNWLADLFLVFAIDVLSQSVLPDLSRIEALSSLQRNFYFYRFLKLNAYAPAFFMGIVWAKYGLLEELKARIGRVALPRLLCLAGCFGAFCVRAYVASDVANVDLLLAPALAAFLSCLLDGLGLVKAGFRFLGRHSGNIWLVHSFFCYYFLECTRIVYATRSVWVDLLMLLLFSLAASLLLEGFWAALDRLWARARRALPGRS